MQYGLPYMGSKNSIAKKIIDLLPPADNFYDLFCGGCAIAHCALLSNKYKTVYANDIEKGMPKLFIYCVNGKYSNAYRWISREDFEKLKDTDEFVRIVWSFGNQGKGYLYSREIEPWKKAYHYAVLGDYSYMADIGIRLPKIKKENIKERRLVIRKIIVKNKEEYKNKYFKYIKKQIKTQRLQDLQNLERLEKLQSLENLERLQNLQISGKDYRDVQIKPNSIIYCDIPYEGTAEYKTGGFNHREFFDWADNQEQAVYISSYNISDNRFECVAEISKRSTLSTNKLVMERVYTQTMYKDRINKQLMLF